MCQASWLVVGHSGCHTQGRAGDVAVMGQPKFLWLEQWQFVYHQSLLWIQAPLRGSCPHCLDSCPTTGFHIPRGREESRKGYGSSWSFSQKWCFWLCFMDESKSAAISDFNKSGSTISPCAHWRGERVRRNSAMCATVGMNHFYPWCQTRGEQSQKYMQCDLLC